MKFFAKKPMGYFLLLFLLSCGQNQSPQLSNASIALSALSEKERSDIAFVSSVLPEDSKQNFVYVNMDGKVYSPQANLANGVEFLKNEPDGSMLDSQGNQFAAPINSDDKLSLMGGNLGKISNCSDGGATGAFHRFFTDNLKANWIGAKVTLPKEGSSLGGSNLGKGIQDTPYLYLGGWGDGTSNISLDVGLVYRWDTKKWYPFVRSEVVQVPAVSGDPRQASWGSVPLEPGTTVDVLFWHIDDKVMISIKATPSSPVVTKMTGIPNAGWRASGTSIRYKIMSSLAQSSPESFTRETSYMLNARWNNVRYGFKNWGANQSSDYSKLFSSPTELYSGGTAIVGNSCIYPTTQKSAPFTISPEPFKGVVTAKGNMVIAGDAVSGLDVSIDFDRQTHLVISPASKPKAPITDNLSPRAALDPTDPTIKPKFDDLDTITLIAAPGQKVTEKLSFFNDGRVNSNLELTVYPLGQAPFAGFAPDLDPKVFHKTPNTPANQTVGTSPWDANMFKVQINKVKLQSVKKSGVTDTASFNVTGTCPTKFDAQKVILTNLELVFTTGRIDDIDLATGKQTVDITKHHLEYAHLTIPVKLLCVAPRITNPSAASPLTGNVGASISGSFTFNNVGGISQSDTANAGLFDGNKPYYNLLKAATLLQYSITSSPIGLTIDQSSGSLPAYSRVNATDNVRTVNYAVTCVVAGVTNYKILVQALNDPMEIGNLPKSVDVSVTCTVPVLKQPKLGLIELTPASQEIALSRNGGYANLKLNVSNDGDAPLIIKRDQTEYTIAPNSQNLIQFYVFCDKVQVKKGKIKILTNDPKTPSIELDYSITCYFERSIKNFFISIHGFREYYDYIESQPCIGGIGYGYYVYISNAELINFPTLKEEDLGIFFQKPSLYSISPSETAYRWSDYVFGLPEGIHADAVIKRKVYADAFFPVMEDGSCELPPGSRAVVVESDAIYQALADQEAFGESFKLIWINSVNQKYIKNIVIRRKESRENGISCQSDFPSAVPIRTFCFVADFDILIRPEPS